MQRSPKKGFPLVWQIVVSFFLCPESFFLWRKIKYLLWWPIHTRTDTTSEVIETNHVQLRSGSNLGRLQPWPKYFKKPVTSQAYGQRLNENSDFESQTQLTAPRLVQMNRIRWFTPHSVPAHISDHWISPVQLRLFETESNILHHPRYFSAWIPRQTFIINKRMSATLEA